MSDKKRKVKAVKTFALKCDCLHPRTQEDGSNRPEVEYQVEKYLRDGWEMITPPTIYGEEPYPICYMLFIKYED